MFLWIGGLLRKVTVKDFLRIGGSGTLPALHWLFFYGSTAYSIILAIPIFKENRQLSAAFYAGPALILVSVILTTLKRQ